MGLYVDESERLGMLDLQGMRAARLVVDTGIHALGWTRERAIETLEGAGLPTVEATIETDRYITMPGQALSYKIGQFEIERQRAAARPNARAPGSRSARSTTGCSRSDRSRSRRSGASWPASPPGRPTPGADGFFRPTPVAERVCSRYLRCRKERSHAQRDEGVVLSAIVLIVIGGSISASAVPPTKQIYVDEGWFTLVFTDESDVTIPTGARASPRR